MAVVDLPLAAAARLTRLSPPFRGLGTLYRHFNRLMIRLGATPVVDARMRDGTILRVDLRGQTDIDAFYRGAYDDQLIALLRDIVDPAKVFLDVGANIGFYSVALGQHLRTHDRGGKVVSFEPLRANYDRLVANLTVNGLAGIVSAYPLGLSNARGEATITLREDFAAGAGTGNASIAVDDRFDAGFVRQTIQLVSLDEWWPEAGPFGPVDLVKIDIEGHEDYFLEGARRLLAEQRPTLLMEVNQPYYRTRGVDLETRFGTLFPPRYRLFRPVDSRWIATRSLAECREIDNVVAVPEERLASAAYAVHFRE